MPDPKDKKGTDKRTAPVEASDLFNEATINDPLGGVKTQATSRTGFFDSTKFSNVTGATPYDNTSALDKMNVERQSAAELAKNTFLQLGTNTVSSFGQGLANTFDLIGQYKSAKAFVTGGKDDFESSLFGLTTTQMDDWAQKIAQNNPILERKEGSFDLTDPAWWGKQIASTGTGIGMGFEALASTAAIELASGGLGTAGAIAKLGGLVSKITKGVRGAEILAEGLDVAKGLKSAATIYGTLNRVNESRMEAMQSYKEIYQDMSQMTNTDGSPKYTEQQLQDFATKGAQVTFGGNMLMLPLDILAFRTMVYNPISGAGEGMIERLLSKIGNKAVRNMTAFGIEGGLEMAEEGGQFIMSDEGKHYAKVLGGLDDNSTFFQRLGKDVKQDEFWNNAAGGLIGSPVIGGVMKAVGHLQNGRRTKYINDLHKDFIQNVGKLDDYYAKEMLKAEAEGNQPKADAIRRANGQRNALKALHLDAMTDKESGFESYLNFLTGTLGELNENKTDALKDLGITATTPEQIEKIKTDFASYIEDANDMKSIYDSVKNKYSRNYVPEVVQDHFRVNNLVKKQKETEAKLGQIRSNLQGYGELSTQGKQQYDANFELQVLQYEANRLNELHANAVKEGDVFQQENVNKIIKENENRLVAIKQNLDQIGQDTAYLAEARRKDKDIIESSVESQDYLTETFNSIRRENEISLQRKNLALWNNKKYLESKAEQAVKKARTQDQLAEAAKNAKPEVVKAREAEIAAANTATAIDNTPNTNVTAQPSNPTINSGPVPGNANLFGGSAEGLSAFAAPEGMPPEGFETTSTRAAEAIFDPATLDEGNLNDKQKQDIKNSVSGMLAQLPPNSSFEDLVRAIAANKGTEFADRTFNVAKKGWQLNGKADADYAAVYNKIFANPFDTFELVTDNVLPIIKAAEEQTDKENGIIAGKVIEELGPIESFDNDNQPIKVKAITYDSPVTNNPMPKMAKTIRLADQTITVGEDGVENSEYEFTSEELGQSEDISPLNLLDPDKYGVGTQLEIRVPPNYLTIVIPVYNEDGSKGKAMTFGDYVAAHNLTPDMQEYKDKIPMIIYDKGTPRGQKGLAFVHDIGWYHEYRFNANNPQEMATAIGKTRSVREAALTSKSNEASITITENRPTAFAPFKTNGEFIPLDKASPHSQLAIALDSENLSFNNRNAVFNDEHNVLLKSAPLIPGFVYDVRRVGMKGGKKAWNYFRVTPQPISQQVQATILQAINIYAHRRSTDKNIREKHDAVVDQVFKKTGLNLKDQKNIQEFLRQFIDYPKLDNVDNNADAEAQIKKMSQDRVAKGGKPITGYIAFLKSGGVIMGVLGQNAYKDTQSFWVNPNMTKPIISGIKHLNAHVIPSEGGNISILQSYIQNYDIAAAQTNKPIVYISEDLSVTDAAPSYKEFLMSQYNTNIRSVNVGTEEKPVYVSSDNMISYDLTANVQEEKPPTAEEIAQENIPEAAPEVVEDTTVQDILKAEMARAASILGYDPSAQVNFNLLDPRELTEEERNRATASLARVAGLTEKEENELVDFFVNQVFNELAGNKEITVSRKAVEKSIRKNFDAAILPMKKLYQDEIARIEGLIRQHPSLAMSNMADSLKAFKAEMAKIDNTNKNIGKLIKKAFHDVSKHTGIDLKRVQEEREDNLEDNETGEQIDFWTEVMTLNPENRATNAMRRFLKTTPKTNKNGEAVKGVFGIPTYENSSNIIQILQTKLADVPATFETMIKAIEENASEYTWSKSIVDRLKTADQQTKLQFTTLMANSPLRLRFTMIRFDKKTNSYTTKVWNTNEGGIVDAILEDWYNTFYNSDLVMMNTDEEGNSQLNKIKAEALIRQFNNWTGIGVDVLQNDISWLFPNLKKIKKDQPITIDTNGALLAELQTKLAPAGSRVKFQRGTDWFQIESKNGKFGVSYLQRNNPEVSEVKTWLEEFGIKLQDKTLEDLKANGLMHNYKKLSYETMFSKTEGAFGILVNSLETLVNKEGEHYFDEQGAIPLDQTIIKSLAKLETKYDTTHVPHGGRDAGKSFFAITSPKFITDRARELKEKDSEVRRQLSTLSFSKNSMWLELMQDDDFRAIFEVVHEGFNAMQVMGKKTKRDNAINKLSDLDYEITRNGKFWDMQQGSVSFKDKNSNIHTKYPGTSIDLRWATMYSPTMSDKKIATLVKTAVLNLRNKDLGDGKGVSQEVLDILYKQTVRPELERMLKFASLIGETNIKSYDAGAQMFLMLPKLNTVKFNDEMTLREAITNKSTATRLSLTDIESNGDLMKDIYDALNGTVEELKKEKLQVWKNNEITSDNAEGRIEKVKYFDNGYLNGDKFHGELHDKVHMAAYDLVVNEMISISNSFMLFAGDPALYYKKDKATSNDDFVQIAKDTFVNVGKRLASQIAPGTKLAESDNENYIQVMLADRESVASRDFVKFSTLINDGKQITDEEYDIVLRATSKDNVTPEELKAFKAIKAKYSKSAGFFSIEAADAQEYTTWKEHLDILTKLGKTPDIAMDITADEIQEAKDLFSSGVTKQQLTDKQLKLIGKVMQPIKPVYTGQIYDSAQDVMRTVYIKSSSFPLIPQLTTGFEIDKLRAKMEEIEKKHNLNVRASYQTANKVGSVTAPLDLWKNDGTVDVDVLNILSTFSDNTIRETNDETSPLLVLPRKNFRIQQEVPFKSGKSKEDKVTYGTQPMKLLFGNGVIDFEGFEYQGDKRTGRWLQNEYNQLHINLINNKRKQLFRELGLDDKGVPTDYKKSLERLQKMLIKEAEERDFPLQTIEGLQFKYERDGAGNVTKAVFTLPLWSSVNSNKFESLLNAIVTNRLIKVKFPGNSYVAGSEEGFIFQEGLENVDQSRMVYTDAWNGKELEATYYADGRVKKAQVMVSSKFRDNDGNLIDLFEGFRGNEGRYIKKNENGTYQLKSDMFDKELLGLHTFRIPYTGLSSGSEVEIAAFLPAQNADLMILPKHFTKQKGLDFDVDKENSYQYWHHQDESGKFKVLAENHKASILAKHDENLKGTNNATANNFIGRIFGDESDYEIEDYTEEEISEQDKLQIVNDKLEDKFLQNKIIEIYKSVFTNPDPKLQAKINSVLNTDYSEEQASKIDKIISSNTSNDNWTPLSGEYQKQKMFLGANGKTGTGAYALDITFHSLAQQVAAQGMPLTLRAMTTDRVFQSERGNIIGTANISYEKTWAFGDMISSPHLGEPLTVDGSRTISDVLNETGQIAVDNEKLQIMGKVNLNGLTLDVHKVFNLIGLDKGADGNSIPFLFMSQPIIREYVALLSNSKSNLADYEEGKKNKIIEQLIRKYHPNPEVEIDAIDHDKYSSMMGSATMLKAIESKDAVKEFGEMQAAALLRFLDMEQYGLAIRNIQTSINTDSKGLGKSFFDVIQKREKLNKLGDGNPLISNATALIGDYMHTSVSPEAPEGYINIGEYHVKPQTIVGAFNVHAISTAYNLWHEYLPYDSILAKAIYQEIMPLILNQEANNDMREIEYKQDIFAEAKKYMATFKRAGFIGDQTANEVRAGLYIDTPENTSLAKYLSELVKIEKNPIIENFIKSNKLFNSFTYVVKKDGSPSLIKYNNTKGQSFDEEYLYNALSSLLEVMGKNGHLELPKIGNKQYTLDGLAGALSAYSMLGNAKQEAVQFTKYIPVGYLNEIGYSYIMRVVNDKFHTKEGLTDFGIFPNSEQPWKISPFAIQYVQHNPNLVKYRRSVEDFNKEFKKVGEDQYMNADEVKPTFVSVYDPKITDKNKFRLYKYDGEKYVRIPILGVFGMDEYQFGTDIGQSLVNGRVKTKVALSPVPQPQASTNPITFSIGAEETTASDVVRQISEGSGQYAELAKLLLPFVNPNTKVSSSETMMVNGTPTANFNAAYNTDSKNIKVNTLLVNSGNTDRIARSFLHEVVHALTFDAVDPHITTTANGDVQVKAGAPAHVIELVRLYNNARKGVNKDRITELMNKLKNAEVLDHQEKGEIYGFTSIHEFMTMALTEPIFQKSLNEIPYTAAGQSFLDKFKEIIGKIMTAIGVKFDEKYTAAHAISTIFGVIEATNTPSTNAYSSMAEDFDPYGIHHADEGYGDGFVDGETELQMDASDNYPDFEFNIKDEKCN